MPMLPQYLVDLKRTIPVWIDKLAHPDGPGRYRFALDAYEPYDIDSSHMMHTVLYTIGGSARGLPNRAEECAWGEYLLDLQRPEDGLMIDAGMERHILPSNGAKPSDADVFAVRRFTTRNCLNTVCCNFGLLPRHPLRHREAFSAPEEALAWIDGLDWSNPWAVGSHAGGAIIFQHMNRLLGDRNAGAVIDALAAWLVRNQDPKTGAWFRGGDIRLNCLINGIFKIWIQVLPVADLPVQYPEHVIDLCLKGLAEDPALVGTPDSCSIFDVALVLDIALRHTDHRRAEVAEITREHLDLLEPMARSDGAFSYNPGTSLRSHGGLHLAPEKDQSDMAGTAINVSAAALLCNLCGLRDELGWIPLTEWRMVPDLRERTSKHKPPSLPSLPSQRHG